MEAFTTTEAYIADFPKDVQVLLKQMRTTIRKVVPKGVEAIKYGIPTFRLFERNIVHFGGFKDHVSFFPGAAGVAAFQKELTKYETSKGTIQFPLNKPLPLALIAKITKYRVQMEMERQVNAKPKKKAKK
jgi:uncharacterized protein YdhG (YjbR/CyaY superfamily)